MLGKKTAAKKAPAKKTVSKKVEAKKSPTKKASPKTPTTTEDPEQARRRAAREDSARL